MGRVHQPLVRDMLFADLSVLSTVLSGSLLSSRRGRLRIANPVTEPSRSMAQCVSSGTVERRSRWPGFVFSWRLGNGPAGASKGPNPYGGASRLLGRRRSYRVSERILAPDPSAI